MTEDGPFDPPHDIGTLTTSGTGAPTLVVIDMQNVFGTPSSEWFTPKFADARDGRLGASAHRDHRL
jgi:hypothetical protein